MAAYSQWILIFYLSLKWNMCTIADDDRYFIDKHYNCNNVYGAISEPDQSTQWVKYLGKVIDTKDCYQKCVQESNSTNRCESYTFHTKQFGGNYANHCYARFGYPLWTPIKQEYVNCGRIIWNCEDNRDCSLNGKCNKNTGNCTCSTGWYGYKCGYLDLQDVNSTSGYNQWNDTDHDYKPTSSWGGSIISSQRDNETNQTKYHMYLTEFDNHCGINSFQINSVITHAISTNGYNSPYQRLEQFHGHFAAQPDIIRGNNGENVLYYTMYNYSTFPECHCQDGSTPVSCKLPDPAQYITVMQWTSQNKGPYKKYFNNPEVVFAVRSNDTDLGGVINSNAEFIGMLRTSNDSDSEIHLVIASNWKDRHSYIQQNKTLFPELTSFLTEDPFLWIDCDKNYHALFHNMSPNDEQIVCGGHAFSTDGKTWIYSGAAYSNSVNYINGTKDTFQRREKPHLIFADDDCTPIALTNGVIGDGAKWGDASYTSLQPIKHD